MEKTKSKNKKLATIISIILSPLTAGLVIFLSLSYGLHYSVFDLLLTFTPFVLPILVYVVVFVFVLRKVDYEFTDVHTRRPILLLGILGLFGSLFISSQMTPLLNPLLLRMLILLMLSASVSFYWKISFHAIGFTSAVMIAAFYVSPLIISAFVLLPVVYWSRIELQKHDFVQLTMGSLSCLVLII